MLADEEIILSRSRSLFQNNRFDDAERDLISLVKKGCKNEEIYNNLGVISYYKKNIDKSIYYFLQALEINSFYKTAIINYFEIIKSTSKYDKIIPLINQYINHYPDDEELKKISQYISTFSENTQSISESEYDPAFKNIINIKNATNEQKQHISRIKSLMNITSLSDHQNNMPHRNLIIAGIDDDITIWFLNILNNFHNLVCIKNKLEDLKSISDIFIKTRDAIINKNNELLYGTEYYNFNSKLFDENVIVALRNNLGTFHINQLKGISNDIGTLANETGYRIIAIIRDPVHAIASWNNNDLYDKEVLDNIQAISHWNCCSCNFEKKIDRLAMRWNFYAKIFWTLKPIIKVYTYEQIIGYFEKTIRDISDYLTLPIPEIRQSPLKLNNYNSDKNFLQDIITSVQKYCPVSINYGYGVNSIPALWDEPPQCITHALVIK